MPILEPYARSFVRHLKAKNRAASTIDLYLKRISEFDAYLDTLPPTAPKGDIARPTILNEIKGGHIDGYVGVILARTGDSTASNHYRALHSFFSFLVPHLSDEPGELDHDPFLLLEAPEVKEKPVPVLPEDAMKRLLLACKALPPKPRPIDTYVAARDLTIITIFIDTGMRLSACAGLTYHAEPTKSDVDLRQDVLWITLKGGVRMAAPFGNKAGIAIDRYLRARTRFLSAAGRDLDGPLWLGSLRKEALTISGIAKMIDRRCEEAGIDHVRPHQFRHTFAHVWQVNDGNETDLMRLMGWTSRQMLVKYGRSAADERAREAHRKNSPADRL